MKRLFAILTSGLLVSGCATLPSSSLGGQMCMFKQRSLVVNDPGFGGSADATVPSRTRDPEETRAALARPTLILSGGSQNGAFGAGLLKQWAKDSPGGRLPEFASVTGISTGSILSTWAFIGEPAFVANEYDIDHESELLNVYRSPSKKGGISLGMATTLLRKNSLADLDPLRKRLRLVIDHALLSRVAAREGKFSIAAVEVDTGDFIRFDMKDMAARAIKQPEGSVEFQHLRDCYVEAIMASSSVPLAAKPVIIDNRMYVDGGARRGAFVEFLPDAASGAVPAPSSPTGTKPDAPELFIVVNGTQWVKPQCSKLDEALCKEADFLNPDPYWKREGAHRKWDVAGLAFRANDIVVNQIYRFSMDFAVAQYRDAFPASNWNQRFHFVRMHRTALNKTFVHKGQTCMAWHKADKEALRPLEFYPNYMRCVQAYGESLGEQLGWGRPNALSSFPDAEE